MGTHSVKNNGVAPAIPDLVLRDAYLKIARAYDVYREKFVSRTELVEKVKMECGPSYAHVPIDWMRDRITTCCKNPGAHEGGWNATVSGHGMTKRSDRKMPDWYKAYLLTPHWLEYARSVREFWGYRCCICYADATKVHHRTYEHLHHEELTDCVLLCGKCHDRYHNYMMELDGCHKSDDINDVDDSIDSLFAAQ